MKKNDSIDYLNFSPTSVTLTITKNPLGFHNIEEGVSNVDENTRKIYTQIQDFTDNTEFINRIERTLEKNNIKIVIM